MDDIERAYRRGSRVSRMEIRTRYSRPHGASKTVLNPHAKTLWGVLDGDTEQMRLLYVFSGPGRLAGTTLLMHDRAALDEPDAMWLYLRSFDIFKQLESNTQRVMVPGTALTYEDSRGFIPRDKFQFALTGRADGVRQILACPRTESIRDDLGYRSLRLRVDPERRLVRSVHYEDLSGQPLKIYTLLRDQQVGDIFLPGAARLEHAIERFETEIDYQYWLPKSRPPASLFEANMETSRFIDRLESYLEQIGQRERIRAEIAAADEMVREHVERLRRIGEGEKLGNPYRD